MDMNEIVDIVHDAESNGLLDNSTVDYTASPWKLKDSFAMHVVSVQEWPSGQLIAFYDGPKIILDGRKHSTVAEGNTYVLENYTPLEYLHFPLHKFPDYIAKRKIRNATGHNVINFDLLAYKAYFGMEYSIGEDGVDTWCGNTVYHNDTLVKSKTLNPDRFGGHTLESLAKSAGGDQKVDFRPHLSKDEKFKHFAADMLYYNLYDLKSNRAVDLYLDKEMAGPNWQDAITLEKCVADLITRQSHRGFAFNVELAEKNIEELDALMLERKQRVAPVLPKKKATKTFMKDFTPPKNQFKKNGELSAHMENFIKKIGAEVKDANTIVFNGQEFTLPLTEGESLVTEVPASIDDTTHIKEWLVSLKWKPSEWKEKDLTVDTRKQKLSEQKYAEAVARYVEQTLASPLCEERCDYLECTPRTLMSTLMGKNIKRPVRVLTNPSFTKGQDKEMCPDLERISEDFPYAKDVVEYLTYKHRRNSILGGGLDWEDGEEAEKGYMAAVRDDGRIPTPADTCGAATSRMKHRITANIPRVTSLYGGNMRGLFMADPENCYQIGYDFASLEARIEAHYCYRYEKEKEGKREYCESLLLEKPHDVHTKTATVISDILGKEFSRSNAKAVKYGCLPMHTKVLTKEGWKLFEEIKVGDALPTYNAEKGVVEMDTVLHKHFFDDKPVYKFSNNYDEILCTDDHRWYGWRRSKSDKGSKKVFGFFEAHKITQEHNIVLTAPWVGEASSNFTDDECAFLGWMASDGYWRWSDKGEGTSCSFGKKKDIAATVSQADSKFWRELEELLNRMGVRYFKYRKEVENGNTINGYKIYSDWMRPFLDRILPGRKNKHEVDWVKLVMSMTRSNLEAFYAAFYLGDGAMTTNQEVISQNLGNIFDGVATAAQLLGSGRISFSKISNSVSPMKTIRVQKRKHITCQELKKEELGVEDTFCLTTNNSSFIIWQDDFIGITGNCTYGAQAAKVAKTIGSSLVEGELVFGGFWEAAQPLKLLKDALQKHWEANDKKYLITIDGRKVPTRAAHAILNSLFQSAGVICAKRSMVRWETLMQKEGLLVDFWKDDWKASSFAMQMIAYHDEAQIEVTKDLVKFKRFATKEECQQFRKEQRTATGMIWSEEHESPKGGWFVAYSKPGELVVKAVEETTQYYKLKVPLSADYVVGTGWDNCH